MQPPLFDENLWFKRRKKTLPHWDKVDFLWKYFAQNMSERIYDTLRSYDKALDVGTRKFYIPSLFTDKSKVAYWDTQESFDIGSPYSASIISHKPQFKAEYYDLITNLLNLHHVNNIQKTLQDYHKALTPGGVFIASFFGEDNCIELKQAFYQAEQDILKGASPRFTPAISIQDAGNLLFAAGFKLPVADKQTLILNYKNPLQLLKEIKNMGENNILLNRLKEPKKPKALFESFFDKIQTIAGQPDGSLNITCEVITVTGWKDDGSMDPKTNPQQYW